MEDRRFDALLRRTRAIHHIWRRASDETPLEQINHRERSGVVSIAFSLTHYVQTEDRNISERVLGMPTIWNADQAERAGIDAEPVRRGAPLALAEQVRIGDLEGWRAYQEEVFARTEAALAMQPPHRWDEIVYPTVPESMQGGFVAMVAGDGPVTLGDLLDVVIYQHAMRHIGEVEHARALVGLGGFD